MVYLAHITFLPKFNISQGCGPKSPPPPSPLPPSSKLKSQSFDSFIINNNYLEIAAIFTKSKQNSQNTEAMTTAHIATGVSNALLCALYDVVNFSRLQISEAHNQEKRWF